MQPLALEDAIFLECFMTHAGLSYVPQPLKLVRVFVWSWSRIPLPVPYSEV